jgi:hypothetical protein
MSTTEYLAFIPLLIYGMGLTTLLIEWKRLFDPKEIFLPYTLLTLILTEVGIYNVFTYERLVNQFAGQSYLNYLIFLASPLLYFLVANVFTPEARENTKEHFIRRMRLFCTLFALFAASNILYSLEESLTASISRIILILVLVLAAFTRKIWLTYVLAVIWVISFFFKASVFSNLVK